MPIQPRAASARESEGEAPQAEPHASQRGVKSCSARNARTSARSARAPSGARAGGSERASSAPLIARRIIVAPAMAWLDRDGVRLHYEVHDGPSDAVALLLSHGFSASAAMWRANVAALAERRRVLAWDMRGHARSDAPEDQALYSHALSVGDMAAVLDAAGVERAALCGMSLGGYLSLSFRLAHPERVAAFVLVDTGPGYRRDSERDGWNDYCERTAAEIEARGAVALRVSPEVAEHPDLGGVARAARGIMAQRDASVIESLGAIYVPTLVVVGSEDEQFLRAADYMATKIPGAK